MSIHVEPPFEPFETQTEEALHADLSYGAIIRSAILDLQRGLPRVLVIEALTEAIHCDVTPMDFN